MTQDNSPNHVKTLDLSSGDIVMRSGTCSFVAVVEVKEPTHPAASGLVVEVCGWDEKNRHWHPKTFHIHDWNTDIRWIRIDADIFPTPVTR